jgi:peptidoglycan hydrolase-like protein with peptidoglycan-binding domain
MNSSALSRRGLSAISDPNFTKNGGGTMKTLSLGMRGCEVGSWQQFLKSKSLYSGSISGKFDDSTEKATREYQRRSRLITDGVVDAATVEKAARDGYAIPQDTRAGGDHFSLDSGVDLSNQGRSSLRRIAQSYYMRTCGKLRVHSGTRTPRQQAQAMWNNMHYRRNQQVRYRNRQAEQEIQETYLEGRRTGADQRATVEAMTRVIERQMSDGIYISRHLEGEAVDILPNTNPPLQPRVLEEVVTQLLGNGRCIPKEDHFHIQF